MSVARAAFRGSVHTAYTERSGATAIAGSPCSAATASLFRRWLGLKLSPPSVEFA